MNIRKNKGITLVALVITLVVLLMIFGISITGAIRGNKEAQESSQFSELKMIQHAILETYTKVQLTKQTLPGTAIEKTEVQLIIDEINTESGGNIDLKGTEYKQLDESDLEKLGILGEKDTYIVNYKTGEVINKTLKVTKSGKALYIYSKSEN